MKSKKLLFALFLLSALLLSACQINTVTEINQDGSGLYKYEFGFSAEDEATLAEFDSSVDDFCSDMGEDLPDGLSFYKETRNENETWCIFEANFASLTELEQIYSETDTRINQLELANGRLTYDLSLDLSGEDDTELMGAEIFWIVKMPGKVLESNAAEQSGDTLTWKLVPGKQNDIRAVSEVGGIGNIGFDFEFDGNPLAAGVAVVFFLCLCCVIPLVIGGVAFFLIRKKKASDTPQQPAEEAASIQ
jgi:predicted small secreted protein